MPVKAIARRLRMSRNTIRRWPRGAVPELRRPRRSFLAPYLASLEQRWAEDCHNGAQLWREMRALGFRGGLRVVTEWTARQRLAQLPGRLASDFAALPSRRVGRILTADPGKVEPEERQHFEHVLAVSPRLARARDLALRFTSMIRERKAAELGTWLRDAAESELASFVTGLHQDQAAVQAALDLPWSNGQTEGQITKLKLIKRQMYGRAKHDLLRARLLQPA